MDIKDINKLHAFNHYNIVIMDLEFQNRYHDRELDSDFNLDTRIFVTYINEMTNDQKIEENKYIFTMGIFRGKHSIKTVFPPCLFTVLGAARL